MDKLYSRKEAAEALGISLSTLDRAKAAETIFYYQETASSSRVCYKEHKKGVATKTLKHHRKAETKMNIDIVVLSAVL